MPRKPKTFTAPAVETFRDQLIRAAMTQPIDQIAADLTSATQIVKIRGGMPQDVPLPMSAPVAAKVRPARPVAVPAPQVPATSAAAPTDLAAARERANQAIGAGVAGKPAGAPRGPRRTAPRPPVAAGDAREAVEAPAAAQAPAPTPTDDVDTE